MHLLSTSNHRVLPTAASFGWTVEAAAADPLRWGTDDEIQKTKVDSSPFRLRMGSDALAGEYARNRHCVDPHTGLEQEPIPGKSAQQSRSSSGRQQSGPNERYVCGDYQPCHSHIHRKEGRSHC